MLSSSFSLTQKNALFLVSLSLFAADVCTAKVFGIGKSRVKFTVKSLDSTLVRHSNEDNQKILEGMIIKSYAGISNLQGKSGNLEMVLNCEYKSEESRSIKKYQGPKYLINIAFRRKEANWTTLHPQKILNNLMKTVGLKSKAEFHVTIIQETKGYKDEGFTSPRTGKRIIPNQKFYNRLKVVFKNNEPASALKKKLKRGVVSVWDVLNTFRGHKYSKTADTAAFKDRLDNRLTMMRKVHLYLQNKYERKKNNFAKKGGKFLLDAAYFTMCVVLPTVGLNRLVNETSLGLKLEDWTIGHDEEHEKYLRADQKWTQVQKDRRKKARNTKHELNTTNRRLVALERLL